MYIYFPIFCRYLRARQVSTLFLYTPLKEQTLHSSQPHSSCLRLVLSIFRLNSSRSRACSTRRSASFRKATSSVVQGEKGFEAGNEVDVHASYSVRSGNNWD